MDIWGECRSIVQNAKNSVLVSFILKDFGKKEFTIPMSIDMANKFEVGKNYKISFVKYETIG